MREIDKRESQSDDPLVKALRSLAGEAAAGAPPEIAEMLAGQFRRHHARRRNQQRFAVAGLACVALWVTLIFWKAAPSPVSNAQTETAPPASAAQVESSKAPDPIVAPAAVRTPRTVRAGRTTLQNVSSGSHGFFALPAYNPTVRLEDTNVLRVDLPESTLRLVGAPLSGQNDRRRVLADFVVGHDGTPYAVRLIAVRNTQ